jgi:hypothetical protein
MLVKRKDDSLLFSSDDGAKQLTLKLNEFAHISFISSSADESEIIVTAAREKTDIADVMSNKRGRYHAYRLNTHALVQLTKEYTNTAIFVPGGGIGYSNGNALVVQSGEARQVHKMGKFNWGPCSLSANEDGSHIGIVKWKGDDRKLLLCNRVAQTATLSKFSLYSYVLVGGVVYYQGGTEVRSFDPLVGVSHTITNLDLRRQLLELCDLRHLDAKRMFFGFSNLTLVRGKLLAGFRISEPDTFESHAMGIIQWSPGSTVPELLFRLSESGRWNVEGIQSTGSLGRATLVRFEDKGNRIETVETKTVWLGPQPSWLDDPDWVLVGSSQTPEGGFQFLPS